MAKRRPIPKGKSKRMFSKHAAKTHKKNVTTMGPSRVAMRGGIRM